MSESKTKLKPIVSKNAIMKEVVIEANKIYENSYDKERLIQAYTNSAHILFKRLRLDEK